MWGKGEIHLKTGLNWWPHEAGHQCATSVSTHRFHVGRCMHVWDRLNRHRAHT